MGLLYSHSKTNRSILSTEQRRYKDYIIDIELIEYDLYERMLFLTHTERKVGIHFRAFSADTELTHVVDDNSEYRLPLNNDCEASQTYAWPKERGQDDWALQIDCGLTELREALEDDCEDKENIVGQFEQAVNQYD